MMDRSTDYDVLVVGGGPGGYVAAIRAAQLGHRTALIERGELGGVCLNWGCIPTKALLRSAEVLRQTREAVSYGVTVDGVGFDLARAVERSRQVAGRLNAGVATLLQRNGVSVFDGRARLDGAGRVAVNGPGKAPGSLTATHIVLATGARPRTLPGLAPDGDRIWTYREAMTPAALPGSIAVIGAGAIGVEFASFYAELGTRVDLVEAADRILPQEDEEISHHCAKRLQGDRLSIHTAARVESVDRAGGILKLVLAGNGENRVIEAERVLIAVGIEGNVEGLGLETTSVEVDRGHIVTDRWGATTEAGVYAVGDVAGPPWLAHKASHEGIACVERFSDVPGAHAPSPERIPACTYSYPQVASIGLTEAQARERGHDVRVGRFPFAGNGRALALGEPDGLVKTVFDRDSGELLGAHMVGAEVTELIHGFTVGQTLEATEAELLQTVFPHPTLSEMLHESTLAAWDRAIHV